MECQKLESSMYTIPGEVEQADALPSCFHSHAINKCPFQGSWCHIFYIFVLLVGNLAV